MKTVIVGDFHGTGIEQGVWSSEFDELWCLSDFDTVDVLEQMKTVEENFEANDKETRKVVGNHDKAIYEGQALRSSTLDQQGLNANALHTEWIDEVERGSELGAYIEDLADPRSADYTSKHEVSLNDQAGLLIHGALDGNTVSYPSCPEEETDFWLRLMSGDDHRENFDEMMDQGYEFMVRGHDHEPEVAYLDEDRGIINRKAEEGEIYRIREDTPVCVTNGAWYDGWYSVIDTDHAEYDAPVVQFMKRD